MLRHETFVFSHCYLQRKSVLTFDKLRKVSVYERAAESGLYSSFQLCPIGIGTLLLFLLFVLKQI